MKKFFKTTAFIFLSGLLFFTGCENFAAGSDLADELNAKVEYEKATRFSVTVAPENYQHGAVTTTTNNEGCRVTDTIKIGFSSYPDYYFTHWEVRVNGSTDTSGQYASIDKPESTDAVATIKSVPANGNITIVPVCEVRPRITSIKPDTEDEFRDAPVRVRFTQSMSSESIYYTNEEQSAIRSLSGFQNFLPEQGAYTDSEYALINKYGYVQNGNITFKNIKISNELTGKSLLEYYKAPYFEGTKTLVVPTKQGTSSPKAGTGITVEISNNMFYEANGYRIPLLSSQNGFYGTNTSVDTVLPTIAIEAPVLAGDAAISYTAAANTIRAYGSKSGYDANRDSSKITDISYLNSNGTDVSHYDSKVATNEYLNVSNINKDDAQKAYVRDRIIYVKASTYDNGSKPDMIGMKLERLQSYLSDAYVYPDIVKLPITISGPNGNVCDAEVTTNAAAIDFTDTSLYPDGVYRAVFLARDKNGNTAYDVYDALHADDPAYGNYYYFIFDNGNPNLNKNSKYKPGFGTYEDNIAISMGTSINNLCTDYKDYYKMSIQYKLASDGEASYAAIPNIKDTTKTVYFGKTGTDSSETCYTTFSIQKGKFYNLKFSATDWFGNDEATSEIKKITYPNRIVINYTDGSEIGNDLSLTWNKPAGEYTGTQFILNTTNSTSGAVSYTKKATEETTQTYDGIKGLISGTTYYLFPRPYISYSDEWEGSNGSWTTSNSNNGCIKLDVKPAAVTNFNVTANSATKVTLNWTVPVGNYTGYEIYQKLSSVSGWTLVDTVTDKTSTSYVIDSGLTAGAEHNFKVVTYADLQTKRTAESDVITRQLVPAPPTNIVITQNAANQTTAHDLSWTAPAGSVDGYDIYSGTNQARAYARASLVKDINDASTSTTIDGLTPGTTYYYSVASYVIVNGEKIYSDRVGNYTDVLGLITRPEPYTFHLLSLADPRSTTNSIQLVKLSPAAGSYTGYTVYYQKDGDSSWTRFGTETSTALAYTVTGLESGTRYNLKYVTFVGTFDQTAYENGTSINTNECTPLVNNTNPDATTNLAVTATTTDSATITWTNPAHYTGVKIYKSTNGTTWGDTPDATVTDGSTTYTFTSLTAGSQYYFKVVPYFVSKRYNAYDTSRNADPFTYEVSSPQTTSIYIRPNGATGVTLAKNSSAPTTSIDVSWTNPTGNFNGSSIFYNTTSSLASAARFTNVGNTQSSTTITGLTAGTTYYVWVIPFAGPADNSPEAAVKAGTCLSCASGVASESLVTTPNNVTNLKVTATTQTSITISYTKPSAGGVSGYAIYKKDLTKASDSYSLAGTTTSTSYTISSLTAGHKYSIYVKTYSVVKENESSGCTAITQYTRPRSLKSCSVETESSTSIRYNWDWPDADSDSSQGITGIIVLYGTSNNVANATYKTWWKPSESQRSSVLDGLSPNTTYYVWLYSYVGDSTIGNMSSTLTTAAKAGGNRLDSSFAMNGTSVKTAPNAPTNLKATTVATGGKINLTWTAPTNGCGGYKLVYGTTSSPATVLSENISSSATSYTFSAASDTKYYFKLYSYNGTWSDTSAKNVNSTSVVGPTNIKPMYPINLSYTVPASGATNQFTELYINWENPEGYDYEYINLAVSSTNDISNSGYRGWSNPTGTSSNKGSGAKPYTLNSLTQGTRYYIWLPASRNAVSFSDVILSTCDGSNFQTSPLVAYTRPQVDKYMVHSSWNITSTSSGMKFDWQYVSDTTSRSKDYTYLVFWISETSDFSKAKKIDYWNYANYSTTTTHTYAKPGGITLSKNTRYYFWYTVTVGKNPSIPADITDANSYTSGNKSVTALY